MSDAVWYYAQGDEEKGPVTAAQLKSLADSGKLGADDLVWKEGMGDWTPAKDVKGLFAAKPGGAPGQAAAPSPAPTPGTAPAGPAAAPPMLDVGSPGPVVGGAPQLQASAHYARGPRKSGASFEPLRFGRVAGQPLLLIGLFLVLFARGCDNIADRNISRLNAKMSATQNELRDPELKSRDREDLQDELKELDDDISSARSSNGTFGYLREWLFMFGTIVLSVGLLAVGFTHDGAARWICLIMLAIITFSLYVGGAAWISAIKAMATGM